MPTRLMSADVDAESGRDPHLDDKIKVAQVVIAARGRVAAEDFLAIYVPGDLYVLANGQAEWVFRMGEREAVAVGWNACDLGWTSSRGERRTHRAVLCEMIIFSCNGNCCHLDASSTGFLAAGMGS